MAPASRPALLDCTCELPRMMDDVPYHNLPMWDTHGGCHLLALLLQCSPKQVHLSPWCNKHACTQQSGD